MHSGPTKKDKKNILICRYSTNFTEWMYFNELTVSVQERIN